METNKFSHGGARKGAGRPKSTNPRVFVGIKVPQDVIEILNKQENRTEYIINAIREYDKAQRKRTILGIEISYTKE